MKGIAFYKQRILDFAARFPDTDVAQFIANQMEKGIVVIENDGTAGVVLYGDRFSNRKEVSVFFDDDRWDNVSLRCIDFKLGSRRQIYWPPGVFVGGRCQRMFRHLERRWRSGW